MVAQEYLIDQGVVLAVYAVLFVLFVTQLAVERKLHFDRRRFDEIERVRPRGDSHNSLNTTKPVQVGTLKWVLHRCGIVACLFQLARYVDPYGQWGIYNRKIIFLFTENLSAVILNGAVSAFYLPLELVSKILFLSSPLAYRNIMIAMGVGCHVIACAMVARMFALATGNSENWNLCFYILWIALYEVVCAVIISVGMHQLRAEVHKISQELRNQGKEQNVSIVRTIRNMSVLQGLAVVVIALALLSQLSFAYKLYEEGLGTQLSNPDPERYSVSDQAVFVGVQTLALIVMFWYSYMSYSVLCAKSAQDSHLRLQTAETSTSRRLRSGVGGKRSLIESETSSLTGAGHAAAKLRLEEPGDDEGPDKRLSGRNALNYGAPVPPATPVSSV